ncbi:MAG: hypothetical protein NC177_00765 [Ruminococcus flavefaciens]|nr:hypothetical protein [Ruminococcus flavefaciens]
MSVFFNFGFEYIRFRERQIESIVNYMQYDLKMDKDDISVPPERMTISYGVADRTRRIRASILEWSSFHSGSFFDETNEYNDIEIIISVDSNFFTARGVKSCITGTISEIEFPHSYPDDRYSWDWYEQLAYQAGCLLTDEKRLAEFIAQETEKDNNFNLYKIEKETLAKYQNL